MYIVDLKKYAIWTSTLRKNAIESKAFLSKSMYIMDSNQYVMELVTYLLFLVVYFYELIVYMLLERNAFDSIAFFSQFRHAPNSTVFWFQSLLLAEML